MTDWALALVGATLAVGIIVWMVYVLVPILVNLG